MYGSMHIAGLDLKTTPNPDHLSSTVDVLFFHLVTGACNVDLLPNP